MHGGAFVINGNVYTTLVHASHAQAEVCDERRQGRRVDDFLESRMILLQQEAGMGHCTAMKRVPYADIRENKEGLAVHFREGQRRFVGQWVILWQTEKQFLRAVRMTAELGIFRPVDEDYQDGKRLDADLPEAFPRSVSL